MPSDRRIYHRRGALRGALFFIRWQLARVVASAPGHAAFVLRGFRDPRYGVLHRLGLALRIARVHLRVPCAHAPLELLAIVEEVLRVPPEVAGDIVECGAYLGGSSAKLSLAAAAAGRRLVVCDSFQGLPAVSPEDALPGEKPFETGAFATPLDRFLRNLERWGEPRVVDVLPGWFEDTLPGLAGRPLVCLFLDVDLQASLRTCLEALWPALQGGRKAFVHDVRRPPVVAPFEDAAWWRTRLGSEPPAFHGAGTGLGPLRRDLGFAPKAADAGSQGAAAAEPVRASP